MKNIFVAATCALFAATLASQPHLKTPAETRLEFQLAADWKVP